MKALKQNLSLFLVTVILSTFTVPAFALWTVSNSGTSQDLNDVHVLSPVKAFVSGNAGTFRVTNDGGATWTAVAIPTVQDINGISFANGQTGYAAVDNGGVIKTNDGGSLWVFQAVGTANNLRDIHFVDANTGWTVGENGSIFMTVDGGANWTMQTSGTTERLESVFFTSASTGFAVGRNGTYLSTSNGGTTWTSGTLAAGADLKDVFFVDANVGFIARQNNFIQKTVDGGATWSTISTNAIGNGFDEMHFVDPNSGWGVNNNGFLAKSTTGGSTWVVEASGTNQNLNSIHCLDGSNCIAVGDAGTIITMLAPQGCITPSGLATSNLTGFSATLNWTSVDAANSYEIQGREVGGTSLLTIVVPNGATNMYNVAGLVPGTSYEWQIRSICGPNEMSDFSPFSSFSTLECIAPAPASTSNITTTTARLNWTPVAEAQGYQIYGRALGSSQVATISVAGGGTSFFDITGLTSGTTYEWSVAAVCNIPGAIRSGLANIETFTTAPSPASKVIYDSDNSLDVKVYPNPANSFVKLVLESDVSDDQKKILFIDMKGALILTIESKTNQEIIDVSDFRNGVYKIVVISGNDVITQKLVIHR